MNKYEEYLLYTGMDKAYEKACLMITREYKDVDEVVGDIDIKAVYNWLFNEFKTTKDKVRRIDDEMRIIQKSGREPNQVIVIDDKDFGKKF